MKIEDMTSKQLAIFIRRSCFQYVEEPGWWFDVEKAQAAIDIHAKSLQAEIERLRASVDKLPKTADGVPVVPVDKFNRALATALQIWDDLADRSGFGLGSLRWDDPELWEEIQNVHAKIICEAAEAAGDNQ